MSDLPPLATGGMSPGGTTTVVRIYGVKIDAVDKKILCSAMCKCDKQPNIGKDGKQLKQGCVSAHLKGLDKAIDHRSNYKQELNYDMTQIHRRPSRTVASTRSRMIICRAGSTNIGAPNPNTRLPTRPGLA